MKEKFVCLKNDCRSLRYDYNTKQKFVNGALSPFFKSVKRKSKKLEKARTFFIEKRKSAEKGRTLRLFCRKPLTKALRFCYNNFNGVKNPFSLYAHTHAKRGKYRGVTKDFL